MKKKIVLILFFLMLGTSFAEEKKGASFYAGGSFIVGRPSHSITSTGGGIHFDIAIPSQNYKGVYWGFRSLFTYMELGDYVNVITDDELKDYDREFYQAGIAIGPKIKSDGPIYLFGTVGILIVGDYAVNRYFNEENHVDNITYDDDSALSLGAEGSIGAGYIMTNQIGVELGVFCTGASSTKTPGINANLGYKLTFGINI